MKEKDQNDPNYRSNNSYRREQDLDESGLPYMLKNQALRSESDEKSIDGIVQKQLIPYNPAEIEAAKKAQDILNQMNGGQYYTALVAGLFALASGYCFANADKVPDQPPFGIWVQSNNLIGGIVWTIVAILWVLSTIAAVKLEKRKTRKEKKDYRSIVMM